MGVRSSVRYGAPPGTSTAWKLENASFFLERVHSLQNFLIDGEELIAVARTVDFFVALPKISGIPKGELHFAGIDRLAVAA